MEKLRQAMEEQQCDLEMLESELRVMEKHYEETIDSTHRDLEEGKRELCALLDSNEHSIELLKQSLCQSQQKETELRRKRDELSRRDHDDQTAQAMMGQQPIETLREEIGYLYNYDEVLGAATPAVLLKPGATQGLLKGEHPDVIDAGDMNQRISELSPVDRIRATSKIYEEMSRKESYQEDAQMYSSAEETSPPSKKFSTLDPQRLPFEASPVTHFRSEVTGHPTWIHWTDFGDRVFVLATQVQKIGTLVSVSSDQSLAAGSATPQQFSTSVLFGKDAADVHLVARVIAEKFGPSKPLLVAVSLLDYSLPTIRELAQKVEEASSSTSSSPLDR
ncbi:unnamed protein product [Cyprideis torosa]|uniref:Uncharacterized protein n=1 Tax=Cyprideis torosa TaxID=163714 RepID=A0A7R8WGR5_9CRUS|nr:unnamed protein product [Cyprideis torosa]CAG0898505.1 unnamed protein product [Cyprideis torosa]